MARARLTEVSESESVSQGSLAAAAISKVAQRYVFEPPRGNDPVVRLASPAELYERFARVAPIPLGDRVESIDLDALGAACELIVEHSVQTSHPRFLNQNFAGPDPVAVAGDWLGAALNTTNATFEAAPVFTLLEDAVLRKLAAVAGMADHDQLPPGMFAPGGSSATLYALQLARHRQNPDIVRQGATGERLVLFVSDAGHYAAVKSAALLGLGMDSVIKVESDADGAMRIDALRQAITDEKAGGSVPFCVIATAGTTVTSAFDDLDLIADVCAEHELWLHVDGCYGGSALFSPSQRHRLDGIVRADSFVWNLHKMMGMTQQCTALLVADPTQLGPCFSTGADYIFQPDKLHGEFDSGDRHFQCARRVDALKLWLAWKVHGDAGFAARIDHSVALADHAREQITERSPAFDTVVAGDFTNVIFRWVPEPFRDRPVESLSDAERAELHAIAPAIKAQLQADGTAMLGFQPVHGVNGFRLLFMNPDVSASDIDVTLTAIDAIGEQVWRNAHASS